MGMVAFRKMHGLGNDFVMVDARAFPFAVSTGEARAIADRHTGIGCDQLITLKPSERADAFMRIQNADGGEVAACGNAARCVAALLMAESGSSAAVVETRAGLLHARAAGDGLITVDMGPARWGWRDIPLSRDVDTLHIDLSDAVAGASAWTDAVGVSMGNPHAVLFVDDVDAIDLAAVGPTLEHHPLFPERANIGIARVLAPDAIRLRVWERGAGITTACGTAACAALVAAQRRGLAGRAATIELDGGVLTVAWGGGEAGGQVVMTGPVGSSFEGRFDLARLSGATS